MWASAISIDLDGVQRIAGNVSAAAFIGGGGQLLLPGGSLKIGLAMFVIGSVLALFGNVHRGDKP